MVRAILPGPTRVPTLWLPRRRWRRHLLPLLRLMYTIFYLYFPGAHIVSLVIRTIFTAWWVSRGSKHTCRCEKKKRRRPMTTMPMQKPFRPYVPFPYTATFYIYANVNANANEKREEKTRINSSASRMNLWILKQITLSGQVREVAAAAVVVDWLNVIILHLRYQIIIRFFFCYSPRYKCVWILILSFLYSLCLSLTPSLERRRRRVVFSIKLHGMRNSVQ